VVPLLVDAVVQLSNILRASERSRDCCRGDGLPEHHAYPPRTTVCCQRIRKAMRGARDLIIGMNVRGAR